MRIVRGQIFEYQTYLKGGKGDKLTEKDVNPDQLKVGIAVEMEHSNNPAVAKEIALDHLAEHDDYYTTLVKAGLVDEPEAIKLYNELLKPSKLKESFEHEGSPDYDDYMIDNGEGWEEWQDEYPAEKEEVDDSDPDMLDYYKEMANFNGEVVQSGQDFKDRIEQGDWIYNDNEFNVLASFIKEMDDKYGEGHHSYGFRSDYEYYHPEFYKKLKNKS